MTRITLPAPWTAHAQIEWENRAANTKLPLWLRVVCLAYGRHEANGHVNFGRGQLSWILGTPPTNEKPFQRAHRATVYNAIRTAVRHGSPLVVGAGVVRAVAADVYCRADVDHRGVHHLDNGRQQIQRCIAWDAAR